MQIGNHTFETPDEAKHFVRHLLAKYPIGSIVDNPQDEAFLKDLIQRNPEYKDRFSCGIRAIEVVRNPAQKATELKVIPNEGQPQRIPWVVCVL